MESTKEQMEMIHAMCWKEIALLKMNLDKLVHDSDRCQKLLNELVSVDEIANTFGLIVFDRYMTQMVSALNMARKYNIHLEINNLDQTVINATSNGCLDDSNFTQTRFLKDFIEWRKVCFQNDVSYDGEIAAIAGRIKISEHSETSNKANVVGYGNGGMKSLESSKNNYIKNDIVSVKTVDNLLNILLPAKNLSGFEKGFEFEAYIVSIQKHKELEFFICLNDDYKTLRDLSNNLNFKKIPRELLSPDDIFCVFEKKECTARECLWRAVFVPEKHNEFQKCIYLIDFGEVIPLTDNCITYTAPLHYKEIPPLAIKCTLEGIEDSFFKHIKDPDKCKLVLREKEFEKVTFRIMCLKDKVLHVLMLETPRTSESSLSLKNGNQTNPFKKCSENDDYNSSSNSDELQLPRSVIYHSSVAKDAALLMSLEIGDKISVIVTHVVSPICFYGIIQNDYSCDNKTFSWNDHQIFPLQKQMLVPPQLNDIILAQYAKDGYWYRAKVINIDSTEDLYEVFYVDFGNTEFVPLTALAKCSKEQLKDPLRAVSFHLSNLSIVSDEKNIHLKSVIENVVVMILDQLVKVEIVERRNNELFVRLIDSQYADIPKMLVDMGVVKEI